MSETNQIVVFSSLDKCYMCGRERAIFEKTVAEINSLSPLNHNIDEKIKELENKKLVMPSFDPYKLAFEQISNRKQDLLIKTVRKLKMSEIENNIGDYSEELPELTTIVAFFNEVYLPFHSIKDKGIPLSELIELFYHGKFGDDVESRNKQIDGYIKANNDKRFNFATSYPFTSYKLAIYKPTRNREREELNKEVFIEVTLCPICSKLIDSHIPSQY